MTIELLPVTQEDRDAAASLARDIDERDIANNILAGTRDRFTWVQHFARHRLNTWPVAQSAEPLDYGWQQIETAPKDGSYIIAARFDHGDALKWIMHSRWMTCEEAAEEYGGQPDDYLPGWTAGENEDENCSPTHWRWIEVPGAHPLTPTPVAVSEQGHGYHQTVTLERALFDEVREAFRNTLDAFEAFMRDANWGSSALTAAAIRMANEAPSQARSALAKLEGAV